MACVSATLVSAAPSTVAAEWEAQAVERVAVTVGKSVLISAPASLARVSVANPQVADALVLTPRQVYLMGKSVGVTNVTLWNTAGEVSVTYDIVVSPDVSRLRDQLQQLFPDETALRIVPSQEHIALSGTTTSSSVLTQVVALAEAYAPGKVLNLLQVGGSHQVMLEVRVAEMDRTMLRRIGVNLSYVSGSGNQFGASVLKRLASPLPSGDPSSAISPLGAVPPFGFGLGQAASALFRFQSGSANWTGFIDALKEDNLVKVLAEPTLIALSGQDAHFLAGGEFPIPVPQAFGVTTIQFQKFGIQLNFRPVVLSARQIAVTVTPEVSELDFANGLSIQGFVVPAITTRRASTMVELEDGQSFAIAGLLRENVRENVSKYPVLGDIPVLGALFRSAQYQKNETELVIIVTPHFVAPMRETQVTLPTDGYLDPDDVDFYLKGRLPSRQDGATNMGGAEATAGRQEKPRTATGLMIP
ncbi:MAG: type II and III secretion system protein family protein [Nitrospira sp. CR2.1]|nr:type II and III secretion system protein family protein [Nitrospira sp. CR2.1]